MQVETIQATLGPSDKSEESILGAQNGEASDMVAGANADAIDNAGVASDHVSIVPDDACTVPDDACTVLDDACIVPDDASINAEDSQSSNEAADNNDSEPSSSRLTSTRSSDLNDDSAQAPLDTKVFKEFREEMRRYYEQILSDINFACSTQSERFDNFEKKLLGMPSICDTNSIRNRSADHPVLIKISSHEQFTEMEERLLSASEDADFKNRLVSSLNNLTHEELFPTSFIFSPGFHSCLTPPFEP